MFCHLIFAETLQKLALSENTWPISSFELSTVCYLGELSQDFLWSTHVVSASQMTTNCSREQWCVFEIDFINISDRALCEASIP